MVEVQIWLGIVGHTARDGADVAASLVRFRLELHVLIDLRKPTDTRSSGV